MKKGLTTALIAALCVALSVCLSACASEPEASVEASAANELTTADVSGEWEVVAIEDGFETLTGDTLSWLGQDTTFGFESDGSCFADTNGNVVDGKWELSGDKLTMTFDDQELKATVTPGTITVEGGMTLEPLQQGYQG